MARLTGRARRGKRRALLCQPRAPALRPALVLLLFLAGAAEASAAQCGPDKLGTSRIAEVGTQGGLLVGLKTYPKTVALADHEVILTFDDGPDARTTPQI